MLRELAYSEAEMDAELCGVELYSSAPTAYIEDDFDNKHLLLKSGEQILGRYPYKD